MSIEPVISQIQSWHQAGLKVVFVSGVFDLLHIEHLRFLEKAKAVGDKLVVGIETDRRTTKIKGPNRPINDENIRVEQLNHLKSVDLAFILPDQFDVPADWAKILDDLKPDIYALSSNSSHLEHKRAMCGLHGVAFQIVHQHNPSISTTILEQRLKLDFSS